MAPSTVGIILRIYRGHIRQCTTAAAALQWVRRETITTPWCRTITADIHLVTDMGACETRYLRGQKAVMLAVFTQVDRETTLSHAWSGVRSMRAQEALRALLASTDHYRQAVSELRRGLYRRFATSGKVVASHRAA
jgi:hypothetical protein